MPKWWQDAVIYQVYPRSFADGDGDGMGDMAGIRSRIPYLAALGVDAIWMSPFYTSPQRDGGYDVADFRDVDPLFGDLASFDAVVAAAHEAGIKVIVDIVPNHSSSEHAWFRAALAAGPGSPERERYHFRDDVDGNPPNDWRSVFGGPAWTRTEDGQWYLHLFDSSQPDFNWDHPEVRSEFHDVLTFWLDRGVDGFRVDVAHGLIKEPGLPSVGESLDIEMLGTTRSPYFDVDQVHDVYREWRRILDSYPGDRMAVAEAWVESPERRVRYVRPDELHQAFNFDLLLADFDAGDYRKVIDAEIATAASVGSPPTWVLSNHDRHRHVTRYGDGETGLARARAASLAMLALPGSAYVYQGEELGLPEVLDLPEELLQDPTWHRSGHTDRGRDGCRVPLPWEATGPSFGFGSAPGWLPQPADWGTLSVQAQDGVPGSTLEMYRAALRVRRERTPRGLTWLPEREATADVLAFDNGALRCVVNFGATPVEVSGEVLVSSAPVVDGMLPATATVWLA
ncbi:alpha-glucosidase [Stackebrandtia albiflava]|uniref:Alpha-glucosidase n=1 Tax=Stackebrandtia albiflava TaxID=406432 RepID=A0A562UY53_9ACTN|nr:glycoside hydrolase family 13 protein [Stackebrandtia albiflava]TWJ10542.1 alpha-glucosidase [Stackebrandtia albiflava]